MRAFIGGTGLARMAGLTDTRTHTLSTDWGKPSSQVIEGWLGQQAVLFLARHGDPHVLMPHEVNYRANLAALKQCGATEIIACNAVGGITRDAGTVVVPDQIIDYTWGRESTFFNARHEAPVHVDFTWPLDARLRHQLQQALERRNGNWSDGGVYAATQGPRLETAAEIRKLENDGGDIVGMTGMPEAVLARELDLPYAMLSLVVNPAAGKADREISMHEIQQVLDSGMDEVRAVLADLPVYAH